MQAEAVWHGAGDVAEARRLLEKAVKIHPGSHDAHERLAELHIRSDRFLEGITHYEQLTRPPEWPQLTYMAAIAAYRLGRFDQARTLAQPSSSRPARTPGTWLIAARSWRVATVRRAATGLRRSRTGGSQWAERFRGMVRRRL
jgi:predicted Zn-dependent protease